MTIAMTMALLAAGVTASNAVGAEELPGSIRVDDVFLSPKLQVLQGEEAEFSADLSYLSIAWQVTPVGDARAVRGRLRIGQESLLGLASRYGTGDESQLGLIEAYGEVSGRFGVFRFGLVPLPFGLQGGAVERDLLFSRSLIFDLRQVGLRDLGLVYQVGQNGFYTVLALFNGESGNDLDNRTWHLAKWGWKKNGAADVGLSAMAGGTTAVSTSQPLNASIDTVFNNARSAQWQIYNLHGAFVKRAFQLVTEFHWGQVEQGDVSVGTFYGGHADLLWKVENRTVLGLRYDSYDPDEGRTGDAIADWVFLLAQHNKSKTSYVLFEWRANVEPTSGSRDNRLQVVWRLSPQGGAVGEVTSEAASEVSSD